MKLRTLFFLLFLLIIGALVLANYCVYRSDKELVLHYLGDWSSSALVQTETPVVDYLNRQQFSSVQKLLDRAFVSRPFLASISVSLDGERFLFSSDRSLQGQPVGSDFHRVSGPLKTEIAAGVTRFKYPISYYRNGQSQIAYLLMILDESYVYDEILMHSLFISGRIVLVAGIVFALSCLFFHHFLMVPITNIVQFVNEGRCRKSRFPIKDFSGLMTFVQRSFTQLEEQKVKIQQAYEYECYLEAILKTVADINKLLVVSRDVDDLLTRSCQRLSGHGDYAFAWIGEVVGEQIRVWAQSENGRGFFGEDFVISLSADSPESLAPTARSVLTNQPQVIADLEQDPSFVPFRERARQAGFKSLIALPLCADSFSAPFGVLVIFTCNTCGFDPKEIDMLIELAGDIGFAVAAFKKDLELKAHLTTNLLTGLPNRSVLLERVNQLNEPEVMVLSINEFKNINEVYGFEFGDALIGDFSVALRQFVASHEEMQLYSLGVDNFALLFEPQHTLDIAEFADTLVTAMENHPYTCFGIAIAPEITAGYARSRDQVVERAELALKWAKSQKKKLGIFDPAQLMVEEHQNNIQWYYTVHKAIGEERIIPYFQGIIDNRTGKVCKYETLMRLQLANGQIVTPFHFLAIAKKTRLYPQLTSIMVGKAFQAFAATAIPISFNISLEDIVNEQVVATLRRELLQHHMGGRVIFEILESEGIRDYETVAAFIREFKALGCQIAIDDFGSGYSNFEHLLNMQVDYLKIDGSLIQNLVHDHNAQVLVRHIHHLAQDLNIQTIAEFVSSREIFEQVQAVGIHYSQGYHFHQPQPFSELPVK